MLAATHKYPLESGLFRLVLNLSKANESIPPTLIEYFNLVLNQIKELIAKPTQVRKDIFPEALDIVLEIKSGTGLYDDIVALRDFSSLTPEVADHLIQELESNSVR